jgi:hypothetical protein
MSQTILFRALKKSESEPDCHAELGSASNKINGLRDPEIVDPELVSGQGSG